MKDAESKIKVLEEILAYLQDAQGGELKGALDESMKPVAPEMPEAGEAEAFEGKVEGAPMPGEEEAAPMAMEGGEGGEEEMTDEEMDELLREHLKG